jgi:hypothetical protein
MASARICKAIDVPADAVWKLISNFGDTSWMPPGTQVTLVGSGVGMERRIAAGPGKLIHERLLSLDERERALGYAIPVNVPFPVSDYRATMRVRAQGAGCELEWSASYECAPDAAPTIEKSVQGMYGMMIDWIAARAKQLA